MPDATSPPASPPPASSSDPSTANGRKWTQKHFFRPEEVIVTGTAYPVEESALCYRIAGCAMAVLNALGNGLREKTYERALCIELERQGLAFDRQKSFPVRYAGQIVDEYIPDLLVEGRVIVEIKVADAICNEHIGQTLNYMRVAKLPVGIVLNFKHAKLQWQKVALSAS